MLGLDKELESTGTIKAISVLDMRNTCLSLLRKGFLTFSILDKQGEFSATGIKITSAWWQYKMRLEENEEQKKQHEKTRCVLWFTFGAGAVGAVLTAIALVFK